MPPISLRIPRKLKSLLRHLFTRNTILLMVGGAVCALILTLMGILDVFVLRQFFAFRGPRLPSSNVVIAAIDDRSFRVTESSTNYPLPRRDVVKALERILEARPRLIVFAMKFTPDRIPNSTADQKLVSLLQESPSVIWNGEPQFSFVDDLPTFRAWCGTC